MDKTALAKINTPITTIAFNSFSEKIKYAFQLDFMVLL
jgi:hypothetical protein